MSTYKKKRGEETFVKGADGKVYEYSVHPERRTPLISEDVNGFCVLVPILESKGFSKESIDSVRSIMNDNKDINSDERRESKRVLDAAALTYVAAAATALLQLLRLITIANRRDD